MDEDTTRENCALTLDLASKAGLFVKDNLMNWVCRADADERRIYLVGYMKTTEKTSLLSSIVLIFRPQRRSLI